MLGFHLNRAQASQRLQLLRLHFHRTNPSQCLQLLCRTVLLTGAHLRLQLDRANAAGITQPSPELLLLLLAVGD